MQEYCCRVFINYHQVAYSYFDDFSEAIEYITKAKEKYKNEESPKKIELITCNSIKF